jgi:hypothetical protein
MQPAKGGPPVPPTPTKNTPAANAGAGVPQKVSLTSGPVTFDYDPASPQPKSVIKVSDIDMSDYPPDRPGPVTRHFNNGPDFQKLSSGVSLTRLVASLAAQGASDETRKKIEQVIEPIQSHFRGKLEDARKEFFAQFPAPDSLWSSANIDQHRKAYDAAAAKLRVPRNVRVAAAVMIALTKEEDREEAVRMLGPNLNRVGIRPGDLKTFHDVGSAYENAMADLMEQLTRYQGPLPKIAADIGQRAAVLQRAGNHLENAFWAIMQSPAAGFPLVYYEALGIYNVSMVFQGLGDSMGGFAAEVSSRVSGYEYMKESLHKELIRVGTQLNDYQIPSPPPRGKAR